VNTAVQSAALVCVLAGVTAAAMAGFVVRDMALALHLALDFWLAAGLLRLALPLTWDRILAVAVVVAVRQVVGLALARRLRRSGPGNGTAESPRLTGARIGVRGRGR
jgi:uncharacterized membrane protein